jgi:hypothetical protein
MARLLSLLMMLALVLTGGAAVPMAMCKHIDAEAHASALESSDAGIASAAVAEETAAVSASKKSALADAVSIQLAGYLLPAEIDVPPPSALSAVFGFTMDPAKLAGRAISPLLEPPLA